MLLMRFIPIATNIWEQLVSDFNALGGYQELLSILLRLILACVLGAVFGFERELKNKPAGYITFLLVSMGSCLFAVLQKNILGPDSQDKSRIIAQVVSGVGFLGAGTILHNRGSVKGITTAALLWVSAAVGLLVGTGGILNIVTAVAATVIFYPLSLLSRKLGRKLVNERQVHRIFVVFEEEKEKELYELLALQGVVIQKTFFHNKKKVEEGYLKEIYIYIKMPKKVEFQELLDNLATYEWISNIEVA